MHPSSYGTEHWTITNNNITKLLITQRAMERAMMEISLEHKTDVIEKEERLK